MVLFIILLPDCKCTKYAPLGYPSNPIVFLTSMDSQMTFLLATAHINHKFINKPKKNSVKLSF